jgi:hypothetical protein
MLDVAALIDKDIVGTGIRNAKHAETCYSSDPIPKIFVNKLDVCTCRMFQIIQSCSVWVSVLEDMLSVRIALCAMVV